MDVILEFNRQKSTTLGDFLLYWEEQKHKLSINTPKVNDAVIITTIHKSKGLEYPVVIVPFLDWSFEPKKDQTMWVRLQENLFQVSDTNPIRKLKTAIVTMKKELEQTPLSTQYELEKEKLFIENVNLLYVAFTRASESLYLLSREDNFADKGNNGRINFLVHQYLMYGQGGQWEEGKTQYIFKQGTAKRTEEKSKLEEVFEIDNFVSTEIHKKFKVKKKRKKEVEKVNSQ